MVDLGVAKRYGGCKVPYTMLGHPMILDQYSTCALIRPFAYNQSQTCMGMTVTSVRVRPVTKNGGKQAEGQVSWLGILADSLELVDTVTVLLI